MHKQITNYSTLPKPQEQLVWEQLTLKQRSTANARFIQVNEVLELINKGNTVSKSLILLKIAESKYSSIRRWIKDYKQKGRLGLVPNHKGITTKQQDWHNLAAQLYLQTSSPSRSSVAKTLLYGDEYMLSTKGVSEYQICNYLKQNYPQNAPERIGKHNHQLNHKVYSRLDYSNLQPGDVYQGDGHTIDLYLAHHNTHKPFRYEFTIWLDAASRYVVGWALSNAESAYTTLESLSSALITHNHNPLYLHIDNGAGFVNKMLNSEGIGFYERLGLGIKKSIPGNAKSKGRIERWFKTFEMNFLALLVLVFAVVVMTQKPKVTGITKLGKT